MTVMRRMLAALLLLGLTGLSAELVLLDHYEDLWQVIPLVLIGAAVLSLAWSVATPAGPSFRTFRVVMVLLVASGLLGIGLHFWANLEFQLEVDPLLGRAELFWKAMHATAPPALAPGIMVQLGLLGLIYAYRQPGSGGTSHATGGTL